MAKFEDNRLSRFDSIVCAFPANRVTKLEQNPWNWHQRNSHEAQQGGSPASAKTLIHYIILLALAYDHLC